MVLIVSLVLSLVKLDLGFRSTLGYCVHESWQRCQNFACRFKLGSLGDCGSLGSLEGILGLRNLRTQTSRTFTFYSKSFDSRTEFHANV